MKVATYVAQARKMNHAAILARKAGNVTTACFAKELRIINMKHAAIAWINQR